VEAERDISQSQSLQGSDTKVLTALHGIRVSSVVCIDGNGIFEMDAARNRFFKDFVLKRIVPPN